MNNIMNDSRPELEIFEFLQSKIKNMSVIQHYRPDFLSGKELDIFIPKINVGVEYNGSAYHASKNGIHSNKMKNYHISKYIKCVKNGVHLISIFDIFYIRDKEATLRKLCEAIINHHKILQKSEYDLNYDYYPNINMNNYKFTYYDVDSNLNLKEENINKNNKKYMRVYTCGKIVL